MKTIKISRKYITYNIFFLEAREYFGKLVLRTTFFDKRTRIYALNDNVFATRDTTHLQKFGDVFRIHEPGIDDSAGKDTISFESMRLPGYFLRHRAEENDFKLRLGMPTDADVNFGE